MSRLHSPSIDRAIGDFTTDRSVIKLSFLALLIGGISCLVAYGLLWLIALFTNIAYFGRFSTGSVGASDTHFGAWRIFIPAIGGLIIGLMARFGSDKIRGHGIPEALEAILIGRSNIGLKVALLKPLSSAISIGTGGPFGAEGPIIMTGGAVGSLFAQFIHLSSAERKTLLVAGAAGGMAAVFGTPVAAVLLAVELLLFEWKPRSLIPVAVASSVAAAMRVPLLGKGPIFAIAPHSALSGEGLACAVVIGLAVGLGSGALTALVYGFEDFFPRLKLHWMWWPAIGGLAVGVGGLFDSRVLGVGYDTIHLLLDGKIVGMAALSLLIGKALVWSFSLGSGTSGGVLAPLLMMGGAMGVLIGQFMPVGSPGVWALIGMSGMMGGTMRAPFTAVIFAFELTQDVAMLPAILIGRIASEAVTVLLLKRSILTEKVARHGHHISREYIVDPFELHRVNEVMHRDTPFLTEATKVSDLIDPKQEYSDWMNEFGAIPVINSSERLLGIVSQGDLLRALESEPVAEHALDIGTLDPFVVTDEDVLSRAILVMLQNDVSQLPVVSSEDHERVVGLIDRTCVMTARLRWYEEEHVRGVHRKGILSRAKEV